MNPLDAEHDRHPPGPAGGVLAGAAGGGLVSAVWVFGSWDVAVALTMVFLGLTVAVVLGAPGWRPFGLAMAAAALAVGAVAVLVAV